MEGTPYTPRRVGLRQSPRPCARCTLEGAENEVPGGSASQNPVKLRFKVAAPRCGATTFETPYRAGSGKGIQMY